MERKDEKLYSTGEFANYFNIKKDTLFYYDKIKLFSPAEVHDNGYRYYTSSQIEMFWTILSLREIGVPIKILQEYFNTPSAMQLNEIAKTQLKKVETEIKKLQKIKYLLTQISSATNEANNAILQEVTIKTLPNKSFIYSKKNNIETETSTQEWSNIYDDFVQEQEITKASYIGSVIAQEDIEKGQFERVDRLFTASKNTKGAIRDGGVYSVFYHQGDYDSIPRVYPQMLAEIKRKGYIIAGDAYEEYLIGKTATNNTKDYITKIVVKVSK